MGRSNKNTDKYVLNINCAGLETVSKTISDLAEESFVISECLQNSRGEAADSEKAAIELLTSICTDTFPTMLKNTSSLLNTISTKFAEKDKQFSNKSNGKK